jgi:hypothetical protein
MGAWVLKSCCIVQNCSGVISITCVSDYIKLGFYDDSCEVYGWTIFFFIEILVMSIYLASTPPFEISK